MKSQNKKPSKIVLKRRKKKTGSKSATPIQKPRISEDRPQMEPIFTHPMLLNLEKESYFDNDLLEWLNEYALECGFSPKEMLNLILRKEQTRAKRGE